MGVAEHVLFPEKNCHFAEKAVAVKHKGHCLSLGLTSDVQTIPRGQCMPTSIYGVGFG